MPLPKKVVFMVSGFIKRAPLAEATDLPQTPRIVWEGGASPCHPSLEPRVSSTPTAESKDHGRYLPQCAVASTPSLHSPHHPISHLGDLVARSATAMPSHSRNDSHLAACCNHLGPSKNTEHENSLRNPDHLDWDVA